MQRALWTRLGREGLDVLVDELETVSPEDARRTQRNPRRVVRALEVLERTGRAPNAFPRTPPRFRYRKAVLLLEVEVLNQRIAERTEHMFEAGLIDEVRALLARYPVRPTATQAIGYKEVTEYLEGRITLEAAKGAVLQATTRYAKRQRTWFRKEPGVQPFAPEEVLGEIQRWLAERLR